jgi:hypothetical protein
MDSQTGGEGQTLQLQDNTINNQEQYVADIEAPIQESAPVEPPPLAQVATVPTEQEALMQEANVPPIPQISEQEQLNIDADSIMGITQSLDEIDADEPITLDLKPVEEIEYDFGVDVNLEEKNNSIDYDFGVDVEPYFPKQIIPEKLKPTPKPQTQILSYSTKPENEYRIINGFYQKKVKGSNGEWFTITNKGSVDALNRENKTNAKTFNGIYTYTDSSGKENNYEYIRESGKWKKKLKGSDEDYYEVTNIGSISALDRQWGTKTKHPNQKEIKEISSTFKLLNNEGFGAPQRVGFGAEPQSFYSDGTPVVDNTDVAGTLFTPKQEKGIEISVNGNESYYENEFNSIEQARLDELQYARTPKQQAQVNATYDKKKNQLLRNQQTFGQKKVVLPTLNPANEDFYSTLNKAIGMDVSPKSFSKDPIKKFQEQKEANIKLKKIIKQTGTVDFNEAKNFAEKDIDSWGASQGVVLSKDQQGQLKDYQKEVKELLLDPIDNNKKIIAKNDEIKKFVETSQNINNDYNEANQRGISIKTLMLERKIDSIRHLGKDPNLTSSDKFTFDKFNMHVDMYNFMQDYIDNGKIKIENGEIKVNISDKKELAYVKQKLAGFQKTIDDLDNSVHNTLSDDILRIDTKIKRYDSGIAKLEDKIENLKFDYTKGESITDLIDLKEKLDVYKQKRDFLIGEKTKLKENKRNFFLTEPKETAKLFNDFSTPTAKAIWNNLPKGLDPKTKFDIWYSDYEKDTKKFASKYEIDTNLWDKYGARLRDALDWNSLGIALSDEEKEYFKRVKTLNSLKSLYLNNDLGFTSESAGFWDSVVNGIGKELKPSTAGADGYISETEKARIIRGTLGEQGFDKKDLTAYTKLEDLKNRGETHWATREGFGEMIGLSTAIVGKIVLSAPSISAPMSFLRNGVRLISLTDRAMDTKKAIKGLETVVKSFDDYYINSTKFGRFIKEGVKQGAQFEVAGMFFNDPNKQLKFANGFVGLTGSKAIIGLYGKTKKALGLTASIFGQSTPKAVQVIKNVGARGGGEVIEESLQELTSIYNDELRTRGFWDEVATRYKDIDDVMQLVVSSFILGGAFGLALPQSTQDAYDNLEPKQKETIKDIVEEVRNDVDEANVEADEVAKEVADNLEASDNLDKEEVVKETPPESKEKETVSDTVSEDKIEEVKPIVEDVSPEEDTKIIQMPKQEGLRMNPKTAQFLGKEVNIKGTTEQESTIKEPSKEQLRKDVYNGDVSSFEYETEAEIPEYFKDRVKPTKNENGDDIFEVTVPNSLLDFYLEKELLSNKQVEDNNLRSGEASPEILLNEDLDTAYIDQNNKVYTEEDVLKMDKKELSDMIMQNPSEKVTSYVESYFKKEGKIKISEPLILKNEQNLKQEEYDKENQTGISSGEQGGEKTIKGEPIQAGSTEEASTSGILEAQEQVNETAPNVFDKFANNIRKLKTDKPKMINPLTGEEIEFVKFGIDWNDLVEKVADMVEKTGDIVGAVKKYLKTNEFYNSLSDSSKENIEKQVLANLPSQEDVVSDEPVEQLVEESNPVSEGTTMETPKAEKQTEPVQNIPPRIVPENMSKKGEAEKALEDGKKYSSAAFRASEMQDEAMAKKIKDMGTYTVQNQEEFSKKIDEFLTLRTPLEAILYVRSAQTSEVSRDIKTAVIMEGSARITNDAMVLKDKAIRTNDNELLQIAETELESAMGFLAEVSLERTQEGQINSYLNKVYQKYPTVFSMEKVYGFDPNRKIRERIQEHINSGRYGVLNALGSLVNEAFTDEVIDEAIKKVSNKKYPKKPKETNAQREARIADLKIKIEETYKRLKEEFKKGGSGELSANGFPTRIIENVGYLVAYHVQLGVLNAMQIVEEIYKNLVDGNPLNRDNILAIARENPEFEAIYQSDLDKAKSQKERLAKYKSILADLEKGKQRNKRTQNRTEDSTELKEVKARIAELEKIQNLKKILEGLRKGVGEYTPKLNERVKKVSDEIEVLQKAIDKERIITTEAIKKAVKDHYMGRSQYTRTLVDAIISKTNIPREMAEDIAKEYEDKINESIEKLVAKEQLKIIDAIKKQDGRLTTESLKEKKIRGTISEEESLELQKRIDESNNRRERNKIMNMIKLGGITDANEFTRAFEKRFGFRNIPSDIRKKIDSISWQMFKLEEDLSKEIETTNGKPKVLNIYKKNQIQRLQMQINTLLETAKPWNFYKVARTIESTMYTAVLSNIVTFFKAGIGGYGEAGWGSLIYAMNNLVPSISNIKDKTYKRDVNAYAKGIYAGYKAIPTAFRKAAIARKTGFNFYGESGLREGQSSVDSRGNQMKNPIENALLSGLGEAFNNKEYSKVAYKTFGQTFKGVHALGALDTFMNVIAGQVIGTTEAVKAGKEPAYLLNDEFRKIAEEDFKQIEDRIKEFVTYNYPEYSDAEKENKVVELIRDELGITGSRFNAKETYLSTRVQELQENELGTHFEHGVQLAKDVSLIAKSDGVLGYGLDRLQKTTAINENDNAFVMSSKLLFNLTFMFLRLSVNIFNKSKTGMPILGAIDAYYGIGYDPVSGEFIRDIKGKQIANPLLAKQRLTSNLVVTGLALAGLMLMMEWDDKEKKYKLRKDRPLDIRGFGVNFKENEKAHENYQPLSISFTKDKDGKFDNYINFELSPSIQSVLANITGFTDYLHEEMGERRMENFSSAPNTKGFVKALGNNLRVFTDNSLTSLSRMIRDYNQAPDDNPLIKWASVGTGVLRDKTKPILAPAILQDIFVAIESAYDKPEKDTQGDYSLVKGFAKNFYGLDGIIDKNKTDVFGNIYPKETNYSKFLKETFDIGEKRSEKLKTVGLLYKFDRGLNISKRYFSEMREDSEKGFIYTIKIDGAPDLKLKVFSKDNSIQDEAQKIQEEYYNKLVLENYEYLNSIKTREVLEKDMKYLQEISTEYAKGKILNKYGNDKEKLDIEIKE